MTNKSYWEGRATARMSNYMRQSETVAKDLERAYEGVYRQINEDSKAILQAFQRSHGLSEAEARALLKAATGKDAEAKLKEALKNATDPKKAAEIKAMLDAPAYKYRIGRLQKVLDNVDSMTKNVYGVELSRTSAHYRGLFDKAYMRSMFDMQRGTGIGFSFAAVDPKTVDAVLAYNWSNEHYSQRIWGHCSKMAETVKEELLIGVLTGRSARKTADNIAQRCGVGAFEARRLVRTESAAIASRAEQAMYEEADIEKYEFLATLDNRTSEECQKLDGKVFAVKDGKIGVNMPPMHAFCRSTTVAYFDDDVIEGLERRARDPETGKTYTVPQDMTYKEWKKSLAKKDGEYKHQEKSILGEKVDEAVVNQTIMRTLGDGLEDVTEEYKKTATPKEGSVEFDTEYKQGRHSEEVEVATWLHNTYGGNITLLNESDEFGVKMPDYRWRDKLWELKTTSTANATDNAVRKAIKQIQEDPGGIVLDYGERDIDLDVLLAVISKRVARHDIGSFDILIRSKGKVVKVLRYKK